jgi:hypothetical protein
MRQLIVVLKLREYKTRCRKFRMGHELFNGGNSISYEGVSGEIEYLVKKLSNLIAFLIYNNYFSENVLYLI